MRAARGQPCSTVQLGRLLCRLEALNPLYSCIQACERYEAACALRGGSHAALYNWGVALSDLARHVRASDADAAQQYLLASAQKYGESLEWNPNNPQASPWLQTQNKAAGEAHPAGLQCGAAHCRAGSIWFPTVRTHETQWL